MSQMKYRIAAFLSMMIFSTLIDAKVKVSTETLVEEVNIYHEYMDIVFVNDDVQTIQATHDVEYLDYSYRFVDINFDGYQDLVIDDDPGANQMSEIFLYHPAEQLFSEAADWEINGMVVNAKRQLVCGFYKTDETHQEVQVLEKGAWVEHVTYDNTKNQGKSELTQKMMNRKSYEALKKRCMH